MKINEVLKKDIKSEKYTYDIILTDMNPLKVSVFYSKEPIWSLSLSEKSIQKKMLDGNLDENLKETVQILSESLIHDIERNLVDKYIDKMLSKKK